MTLGGDRSRGRSLGRHRPPQVGLGGTDSLQAYLLTLYLGLRLQECTGLARADLRQDADTGLLVLDLRHNRFRRLKNSASERTLPVPGSSRRPSLRTWQACRRKGVCSRRYQTRRACLACSRHTCASMFGAESATLTWHSIRHSVEDHLRERVPDAVRYYVQGRAEPHASARGYGRGVGLKELAKWVETLSPLA